MGGGWIDRWENKEKREKRIESETEKRWHPLTHSHSRHTHTHTHTNIYIYIYINVSTSTHMLRPSTIWMIFLCFQDETLKDLVIISTWHNGLKWKKKKDFLSIRDCKGKSVIFSEDCTAYTNISLFTELN